MSWKQDIINEIDIGERESNHGIKFKVFENAPESVQLNEDDIGKRVWYADLPRTKHIKLINVVDGIYRISRKGENTFMSVYPNEVLLHPSEWKKDD